MYSHVSPAFFNSNFWSSTTKILESMQKLDSQEKAKTEMISNTIAKQHFLRL
uniref:Uncharacterized protein n=1 Tax=Rhizophora mucronata TaxID=61149 RepID=A0A2P2P7F4_RHIMU